jgi:diaminopimelate decarboxylase
MALLPHLEPQPCAVRRRRAVIGGRRRPLSRREFGTAAYVLDEDDFRARARAFRDAYAAAFDRLCGGADVYYAGKAFLCAEVARWVMEEGLSLDVCTGGELAVASASASPVSESASTATTKRSPSCARR